MVDNILKYLRGMAAAGLLIGVAAALAACFKGFSDNSLNEPLIVTPNNILKGKDASKAYFSVRARDAAWTLSGDEEWCSVDKNEGEKGVTTVTVTFLDNSGDGAETRKTTLVITSGVNIREIPVEQLPTEIPLPGRHPDYEDNKYIFESIIQNWYFWDSEVASSAASYNQSYVPFFEDYLNYINDSKLTNRLDGNVWSAETEPYLYSYITRTPIKEVGLDPLSYGMEFDLRRYVVQNASASIVGRVLYVLPGSPAQTSGLRRGDWFYSINGVIMGDWVENRTGEMQYKRLIDTLVRPVQGESPRLGMLRFEEYSGRVYPAGREITVSSRRFRGSPIIHREVFTPHGTEVNVGYLVYNSFDPQFENELVDAFRFFKEEKGGITHLVLDLRYNRTGTVEMAERMANLVVPASAAGKVFAEYEFNGRHPELNRKALLSPDPGGTGLPTLFVLTSEHTAGAAELLINAFKGLDEDMTLVMIGGEYTEGMNTGMIARTYDTDDYQYKVRLVAFRCKNAKGEGDYHGGLVPNGGTVDEWTYKNWRQNGEWGWKEDGPGLNPTQDPLLNKAVDIIKGYENMPGIPVTYGSSGRRKSGLQRIFSVQAEMTMEAGE